MGKADGAKTWARVLSELAQVTVTVEWERPAWRVRWRDGPTRQALMDRAIALGEYRVAAQLPASDLRFARTDSSLALALGWLAQGSPQSPARVSDGLAAVEAFCEDTGYPQTRFDDRVRGAADLLVQLSAGDAAEMGALLARANPPVEPQQPTIEPGPELRGQVVSYRWPSGGPPEALLGPSAAAATPPPQPAPTCQRCGKPLPAAGRRGRPAKYCSGACRTAAHRAAATIPR
jgi:hypothetical protein